MLESAAVEFIGPLAARRPAYGLLYRSFDHRRMKTVCENLQKPTLHMSYKDALLGQAVGNDAKAFATMFPDLQEQRHSADYDPMTVFDASQAASVVDTAEEAILTFERISAAERTDILALLMVGVRK